jgi:hypothetical protein
VPVVCLRRVGGRRRGKLCPQAAEARLLLGHVRVQVCRTRNVA